MATRSDQKFDALELERVLVCGEEVINAQGQATIHYPSCRTLAKRFGTAHSTIAKFARDRDCYSRRDVVKAKLQARIEQKLTERRAEALTTSRAGTLSIIDAFLEGFAEAITSKQVRMESVADFNVMVRLREFLAGGADQRVELQGNISLEALQARYQRWLQSLTTPTVDASTQSSTQSSSGSQVDDVDRLTEEDDRETKPIRMASVDNAQIPQDPHDKEEHNIVHPIDQWTIERTRPPEAPATVRLARSNAHK